MKKEGALTCTKKVTMQDQERGATVIFKSRSQLEKRKARMKKGGRDRLERVWGKGLNF